MRFLSMFTVSALVSGCANSIKVIESDTGSNLDDTDVSDDTGGLDDTADTGSDSDWAEYDNASLVILSPESGAFLPYGDSSTFEAEVRDADGNVLDFDDIVWSSDVDAAWALEGAQIDDDSLDVGTHALTAIAELPNGDRLAYTIGGVLVQSPYTGIYSGTLQIDAAYDTYAVGCSGATTITVDAYGETVEGEASCLLSLNGYDLDTAYVLTYENAEGSLDGTAAIDFTWYQYEIDSTGSIDEDGNLSTTFTTDFSGLALDGTLTATRLTRDLGD